MCSAPRLVELAILWNWGLGQCRFVRSVQTYFKLLWWLPSERSSSNIPGFRAYLTIAEAANSLCLTLRAVPEGNEKKSGSFGEIMDMLEIVDRMWSRFWCVDVPTVRCIWAFTWKRVSGIPLREDTAWFVRWRQHLTTPPNTPLVPEWHCEDCYNGAVKAGGREGRSTLHIIISVSKPMGLI